MSGGHVVWLPRQHSILKKDFFQMTTSKPLKQYDPNLVAWVRAIQNSYNNGSLVCLC